MVPGPGRSLKDCLNKKILDKDGNETEEYLINEHFIAYMDYLMACSVQHSLPNCREHQSFYRGQVALYKKMDGLNGRRSWRKDLCECLQEWEEKFPSCKSTRQIAADEVPAPADKEIEIPSCRM